MLLSAANSSIGNAGVERNTLTNLTFKQNSFSSADQI